MSGSEALLLAVVVGHAFVTGLTIKEEPTKWRVLDLGFILIGMMVLVV